MEGLYKINWIVCPQCKYRYYISLQLLEKGIDTICPKCRLEFAPMPYLELSQIKSPHSAETTE
jgi:hypothetical protein